VYGEVEEVHCCGEVLLLALEEQMKNLIEAKCHNYLTLIWILISAE